MRQRQSTRVTWLLSLLVGSVGLLASQEGCFYQPIESWLYGAWELAGTPAQRVEFSESLAAPEELQDKEHAFRWYERSDPAHQWQEVQRGTFEIAGGLQLFTVRNGPTGAYLGESEFYTFVAFERESHFTLKGADGEQVRFEWKGEASEDEADSGGDGSEGATFKCEAENFTKNEAGATATQTWTESTEYSGYSGTGYLQALPDDGSTDCSGTTDCGPHLVYEFTVETETVYYPHFRMYSVAWDDDSLHWGFDGTADQLDMRNETQGTKDKWLWWTGNGVSLSPGTHTLDMWMREDGARIDQIMISTFASSTAADISPATGACGTP